MGLTCDLVDIFIFKKTCHGETCSEIQRKKQLQVAYELGFLVKVLETPASSPRTRRSGCSVINDQDAAEGAIPAQPQTRSFPKSDVIEVRNLQRGLKAHVFKYQALLIISAACG